MMIPERDAEELSKRLGEATSRVAQDYAREDVIDEESFSGQLCGRLKETLLGFETGTLAWQVEASVADGGYGRFSARSLGKMREEPIFGADLVVVIEARAPGYDVKKGFLAQAKRLERGKRLTADVHAELRDQCRRMLTYTPSSFVFLYHTKGVHVVSANAVVASSDRNPWVLPTWPIHVLYYDFAICWIGDNRLRTTSRRSLGELRAVIDAEAALRLVGRRRQAS